MDNAMLTCCTWYPLVNRRPWSLPPFVQVSLALRSGSAPVTPDDHAEAVDAGSIALQHVAAARAALRQRVVLLTRAAAAAGPETNEVECGKV
jgi:hypothetical protein